jgi:hypothetical protein
MTGRGTGTSGLPSITLLSTVTAMSFFVCLFAQGGLAPLIARFAAPRVSLRGSVEDGTLKSTPRSDLAMTDVAWTPPRRIAAPSGSGAIQLVSLTQGDLVQPSPPVPHFKPFRAAQTKLVPFDTAPFPYTPRGSQRPAPYRDNRVLLHIPEGFDASRPGVIIVFFHGFGATLSRDVWKRQQVPAQVSAAGINAVLVAPQFAVDARDSNPGKFANPGAFRRFLDEAARKLARLDGNPSEAGKFDKMPVILVAYSGGFVPCAWAIHSGGIDGRIKGVVLLDALYGQLDKFLPWITKAKPGFFISAYGSSTQRQNHELEHILSEQNVAYGTKLGRNWEDRPTFLATGPDVRHRDYVTQSWTKDPIEDVLARLDQYKLDE